MKTGERIDRFVIFEELGLDWLTSEFRSGEIIQNQVQGHKIIGTLHPFYFKNKILIQKIENLIRQNRQDKRLNSIYPEKIIKRQDSIIFAYPFMKYRTLAQVIQQTFDSEGEIDTRTIFSIILSLAEILDTHPNSPDEQQAHFHGLLTPDQVLIDFDGKIYLKNFNMLPHLELDENILGEIANIYFHWLPPEWGKPASLTPHVDIYQLGLLAHFLLFHKHFEMEADKIFQDIIDRIEFQKDPLYLDNDADDLLDSDQEELQSIRQFFFRTLHPAPGKRFVNVQELKQFISHHFQIHELSSITFNLAYYMDSLYGKTREADDIQLTEEINQAQAELAKKTEQKSDELMETLLNQLNERQKSRKKTLFVILTLIASALLIASSVYFLQVSKIREKQKIADDAIQKAIQKSKNLYQQQMEEYQKSLDQKIAEIETEKQKKSKALQKKQDEIEKIKQRQQAAIKPGEEKPR